ncbi:hypothetical protein GFB85_22270 [Escherichia coli]|nr:hypothetical protein [Escherichia coli]NBZ02738.1 hypothetical protein [Escherichia coli]NBZ07013.1 hypothetical protein [Escherichia coli]NBZ70038.1 hypothetical protein [Escherichia coli]NBZ81104.1 hypothetical protein [Escherichia coli]
MHHNYKTMCLTHKKQIIKLICYIIIAACNNNIIYSQYSLEISSYKNRLNKIVWGWYVYQH